MFHFDLAEYVVQLCIMAIPFLTAITFHEAAHGYAAYRLGDPTAKLAGRLTLNPLKHLDLLGTVALLVTRFIGWAKPVPVNARYFRNPRKGMMWVALAGPGANFLLAVAFAGAFRLWLAVLGVSQSQALQAWFSTLMQPTANLLGSILAFGALINLGLGFFNLIPIPPLDGSNILAGLLPRRAAMRYMSFGRYGFLLVILIVALGQLGGIDLLGGILMPCIDLSARLLF
ncbi:MAG: site-2 protease family protein [Desulfovibrionaceae bacterium]